MKSAPVNRALTKALLTLRDGRVRLLRTLQPVTELMRSGIGDQGIVPMAPAVLRVLEQHLDGGRWCTRPGPAPTRAAPARVFRFGDPGW